MTWTVIGSYHVNQSSRYSILPNFLTIGLITNWQKALNATVLPVIAAGTMVELGAAKVVWELTMVDIMAEAAEVVVVVEEAVEVGVVVEEAAEVVVVGEVVVEVEAAAGDRLNLKNIRSSRNETGPSLTLDQVPSLLVDKKL